MGAGEARQRRLLHPRRSTTSPTWRAPSTTTPRPTSGRPRSPTSCARSSRAPGGTRRPAVRRLAARPRQRAALPEALDRRGADGGRADQRRARRPGVAPCSHGATALAGREGPCYSGTRPGNRGLFHTGCGGGADGKGDLEIFSLTTSIQAVGEGNYGRLGPDQQRRYTDANAETMFSEPATGGTPDEQPGAMPEIFPSRRVRPDERQRRRTSTAAGPAARWSCRPGATTARPGR